MDKKSLRIAVVGAGIFGSTISWFLAKEGFNVDLFDEKSDIMKCASEVNQYRLHRGYHYPRSEDTINECLRGEWEFRSVYGDAVIDDPHEHYYAIAKEDSFLTSDEVKKIYDKFNLEYDQVNLEIINNQTIESVLKVRESIFDYVKLKEIVMKKLSEYKVNLYLNRHVEYDELEQYDLIVIATYALTNSLLKNFPNAQNEYQFELVEKIVLDLPQRYKNKSVVVQDGPFTCIDPLGSTPYVLMGNVTHAIHHKNIGKYPILPPEYRSLLNNGIISNPPITKINEFLTSAEKYFPGIKDSAIHIGSMYTFRTVLPFREHDDARPTIVRKIGDKTISVFSGKIPSCITAAKDVVRITKNLHNQKKVNIGIIGVGKWGKNLLHHFNANSNIVSVANKNNVDFIKQNYPYIKSTLDYREILQDPSIEAVVISTPIESLSKIFEEALQFDKHIFIEKPVAHSYEELNLILDKYKDVIKNKVICVGYLYLHNPIFSFIKSINLKDPIKEIHTRWTKNGTFNSDLNLNLLSHELSIIQDLFPTMPLSININKINGGVSKLDEISIDLIYSFNKKASISINRIHPFMQKEIKFITHSGSIYYWIDHTLFEFNKETKEFKSIYHNIEDLIKIETSQFIEAIVHKDYSKSNLDSGIKVLKIIDNINQLQ